MSASSHFFKPVPELLNAEQKYRLELIVALAAMRIRDLLPAEQALAVMPYLNMKSLPFFSGLKLKDKQLREIISEFQAYLKHPCPQNRIVGDPGAMRQFLKVSDIEGDAARVNADLGIYKGYVFYYKKGSKEVTYEREGLLGLTALNDENTPPVTKEAVLIYISKLIMSECLISKREAEGEEPLQEMVRSVLAPGEILSNGETILGITKKTGDGTVFYLESMTVYGRQRLYRYQVLGNSSVNIHVDVQYLCPSSFKDAEKTSSYRLTEDERQRLILSLEEDVKRDVIGDPIYSNNRRAIWGEGGSSKSYATEWMVYKLQDLGLDVKPTEFECCSTESSCTLM